MKAETPLYQHQEEIHLFTRKKTLISLLTDLPPIKMIMGEWKPAVRVRSKLILVKNVYRGGGRGGILCLTNVRSSVGLHHSSQQGQHMKLISHQLPTGPLLHWSANVIRPPHKRCGKQTGELPKHNGAYERCSQKKKKKIIVLFKSAGTFMAMFVVASASRHSEVGCGGDLAMNREERNGWSLQEWCIQQLEALITEWKSSCSY